MPIKDVLKGILEWFPDHFPSREVIKREAFHRVVRPFIRGKYEKLNYSAQDWDNLIILDACRYDTFVKYNSFRCKTRKVNSNASHTLQFLKENFFDQNWDTVYVTANPQVARFENNFFKVLHLWRSHWDKSMNTVLPAAVVDETLKTATNYPHKKIIAHFMQPHYPFIGPTGRKIKGQGSFLDHRKYPSPWEMLFAGKLSVELVKKAYVENLQLVLPYVKRLANHLEGKTVITSDHGNLFGKKIKLLPWKIWGHPINFDDEELTSVPWLELPFEKRKKITYSQPTTYKVPNEEIKRRLKHLGYI